MRHTDHNIIKYRDLFDKKENTGTYSFKTVAGKTDILPQTKSHIFSQTFVTSATPNLIEQGLYTQEFLWQKGPTLAGWLYTHNLRKLTAVVTD